MPQVIIDDITIGGGNQLVLIAGPCVIESKSHSLSIAREIRDIANRCHIPYIFKASFDKANRTSIHSFRGPGLTLGLNILQTIKEELRVPLLTDIHESSQASEVAKVVDILQIPAFLSRQTNLIIAAAETGCAVNIKKGQFMSPSDMPHAIEKITASGNHRILITERGVSFGYNNLVVDMRSFPIMQTTGCPVIFDVTHSLQLPGGGKGVTTGQAQYIKPLAAAGVAAGVDGIFLEVHDQPERAKSDPENSLRLNQLEALLNKLIRIDAIAKDLNIET